MTLFQSLLLGLIQGITEFLPVSSSGHLNLAQHLLNLSPSLTLDIFLNTATFFSVLFFFRNKIAYFFKNLPYIIVGSLPTVFVGLFLKDQVENIFSNIHLLPFFFFLTGLLLLTTKFLPPKSEKLNYQKSFIIGIFQAIAIMPAVSRSGSTIFAGLLMGLSPLEAFNFSFSLFIPASLGALLLDFKNIHGLNIFQPELIITFLATFIIGVVALSVLNKVLVKRQLWYFAFYVFTLALILFVAL